MIGFWIFLGLCFVGLMLDKGLVDIANAITYSEKLRRSRPDLTEPRND